MTDFEVQSDIGFLFDMNLVRPVLPKKKGGWAQPDFKHDL